MNNLWQCPCPACPKDYKLDLRLLRLVADIQLAVPGVSVSSGHRCAEYNAQIGGSHDSYHVDGKAADLRCTDSRTRWAIVYAAQQSRDCRGIEVCNLHVHVDVFHSKEPVVLLVGVSK